MLQRDAAAVIYWHVYYVHGISQRWITCLWDAIQKKKEKKGSGSCLSLRFHCSVFYLKLEPAPHSMILFPNLSVKCQPIQSVHQKDRRGIQLKKSEECNVYSKICSELTNLKQMPISESTAILVGYSNDWEIFGDTSVLAVKPERKIYAKYIHL